jgi:hypothetical protein
MVNDTEEVQRSRRKEYFIIILKLWGNQLAGPILAAVTLILGLVAAYYAGEPSAAVKVVKYSAFSTATVSILLIFVAQYQAWSHERDNYETEQKRHTGADIRGRIDRAYLDMRTYTGAWLDLPHGCTVKFYIKAANHNDQATWFQTEETQLELRIGERCFHGEWEHIPSGLAVKDYRLPDKTLRDLFDEVYPSKPLQQGYPWQGYVSFMISDFNYPLVPDQVSVTANVRILIKDTLEKVHVISGNNVELIIGRLCLMNET